MAALPLPDDNIHAIVRGAVNHLTRRGVPAEREDLQQEGLRIAYQTLARLSLRTRTKGRDNPAGYTYIAVRRELGNYISRNLAVPSIGCAWALARTVQDRDPVSVVESLPDASPSPEEALLHKERVRHRDRDRIALRRALDRLLDADDRRIVDCLFGLDGLPDQRPRHVARILGIDVRAVYRARNVLVARAAACGTLHRLRESSFGGDE
jgi:hypothetical protein